MPPTAPSWAASRISAFPSTPESGSPAAIDFATVMMSGSTPKCSIAKSLPVRAKPVCTSSAIRQMPYSSQIDRSPSMNACGAGRKPPSPWTGSTMIAATCSAATCVRNIWRSSASAVSVSGPR